MPPRGVRCSDCEADVGYMIDYQGCRHGTGSRVRVENKQRNSVFGAGSLLLREKPAPFHRSRRGER